MSTAIAIIEGDIYSAKEGFNAVLTDRSINFEREANFAIQVLTANDYAMGIAVKNRQSVVNAVTNLAAMGLTLNPAKKQAYLVPRDGKICLDISYMGMVELAVASGSVRWVKAELVREADQFQLTGLDKLPTHNFNPFGRDRGAIVGVYCVAKTVDGDYLSDTMSLDEIYDIRDRSSAWKAWIGKQKKCPWVTDEGEMIKKTIVKRSSKMWPKTERLDQAIHHLNNDAGEGLAPDEPTPPKFVLSEALAEVEASTTAQDLVLVWQKRVKQAQVAKDTLGYDRLKQAVVARHSQIAGATHG
jgi:recombination protein RecT